MSNASMLIPLVAAKRINACDRPDKYDSLKKEYASDVCSSEGPACFFSPHISINSNTYLSVVANYLYISEWALGLANQ